MATKRASNIVPLHPCFSLEVVLRGIRPAIWRRLHVDGALTLRELHHVLQIAFGWQDCHLHEFRIGRTVYGMDVAATVADERDYRLYRVLRPQQAFQYVYDFGDDWTHDVQVSLVERMAGTEKAVCIGGAEASPPEDIGGPSAYMRSQKALANPRTAADREDALWARMQLQQHAFDLDEVNRALRGAGTSAFRRKRERLYEGR